MIISTWLHSRIFQKLRIYVNILSLQQPYYVHVASVVSDSLQPYGPYYVGTIVIFIDPDT